MEPLTSKRIHEQYGKRDRHGMIQRFRYLGLAGLYLFVISVPYSVALSETGFWISIVSALAIIIINKRIHLPPRTFTIALALFFILVLITVPFSMDVQLSIKKLGILRWLFFPYIILNLNLDRKSLRNLFTALIAASSLFALFLIVQHLLGRTFLPFKFDVYQTVNSHNHNLSDRILLRLGQYYAMLSVFLIVSLYEMKNLKRRLAVVPFIILFLISTYFSYGRDTIIGIWSSLFLWGLMRGKYIVYSMVAATAAGLLFIVSFPHSRPAELFYTTIHFTSASGERYGSNMIRIHMLQNTLKIIQQHPWTGIGFNCYGEWTKKHDPAEQWERISFDPIESLATTGILGFTGFVIFYLALFTLFFRFKDPLSSATLAMFLVFSISGTMETMFFNSLLQLRIMMFFTGLVFVNYRISKIKSPSADL